MSQITAVFTIQANPMLHHKILHTVTAGVVRDTTRSLSLRIIQIVAHSVTHTVTHSIIHHYYCIYCYFHGASCNYCYYYGEYQWLHELWDEKDAERGTSRGKRDVVSIKTRTTHPPPSRENPGPRRARR